MKAAADRSLPPVINCIWPRIRCVTWFQTMFKCIQAGLCSICVHPFHLLERQDDSIVNINTVHFSSYVGGMQFACKPKTFTKFDYCPIITKWLLLAVKVKILTRALVKMSYNGNVVYDFVTDVCISASLQCLSLDISLCIFLTGCIWIKLYNSAVHLPVQWRSNKLKHVGSAGAQVSGWREYQTISPQ